MYQPTYSPTQRTPGPKTPSVNRRRNRDRTSTRQFLRPLRRQRREKVVPPIRDPKKSLLGTRNLRRTWFFCSSLSLSHLIRSHPSQEVEDYPRHITPVSGPFFYDKWVGVEGKRI